MLKTERIANIQAFPTSGIVRCPSCKTNVTVDEKYCHACGELVDYKRNYEILKNWSIDLFNYRLDKIQDGMVLYHSRFEDYTNAFHLKQRINVIPEKYSKYNVSYNDKAKVFQIRLGWSKYGLLDQCGNDIISPICDKMDTYIDDRNNFIVQINGKEGVINTRNETVIPLMYDYIKRATPFNKDYYIVEKAGKYGLVNYENIVLIPIEYDAIGEYSERAIPVRKNDKWGFYDINSSNLIIPFRFDRADTFKNNTAKVTLANQELYIDILGHPTLPEGYGETFEVESERVIIRDINGNILRKQIFDPIKYGTRLKPYKVDNKKGAITPDGYFMIPPIYGDVRLETKGLVPVKCNNDWGVLSAEGKIIIPFKYDDVCVNGFDGLIRVTERQYLGEWFSRNSGVINKYGETIIPCNFLGYLHEFNEGLCWFQGDQYGIIMDKFGNYVRYNPIVVDGKWEHM